MSDTALDDLTDRIESSLRRREAAGSGSGSGSGPDLAPRIVGRGIIPLPDLKFCAMQLPGYDPWRDSQGFRFDPAQARLPVDFFHQHLSHVKGPKARTAFRLSLWEIAILVNLFGWVREADPTLRRYNESLIMIGRKNGKTPFAAGILLYLLMGDPLAELGMEIAGAAAEYGQACLVFDHAAGMIEQGTPFLRDQVAKLHRGQKKLIELGLEQNRSNYRPVCAKSDHLHGLNLTAVVVDELHTQANSELLEVLSSSTSGRRNPLMIEISTCDFDRPSICNTKQRHAERVREGVITDPHFLPALWLSDPKAPIDDPKTWLQGNPNLGVCKSVEYMIQRAQRAIDDPTTEHNFRRLDLNQNTKSEDRWLLVEKWDACARSGVDLWAEKTGHECVAALDLSSWSDFTALALLWADQTVLVKYWIPRPTAERRQRATNVPYLTMGAQGHIELLDDDEIDYAIIRRDVLALAEIYPMATLAIDRRFQGAQIGRELHEHGCPVVNFDQSARAYNAPTLEFVRRMNAGTLRHDGNPVSRWQVNHCQRVEDSSGNVRPSKGKSADKVDGVVAMIMAHAFLDRLHGGESAGAPLAVA